jgi:Uma2 family endonuclease
MPLPDRSTNISVEDYLKGEESAEVRHEYVGGEVYAMMGASRQHNGIAMNLGAAVHARLRGGPCRVFMSDMKVRLHIARDDAFYYPDLIVACDPDDRARYYVERPRLIVEVLSDSTERIDRREKLLAYIQIPSLEEYLLLSQERVEVTLYRRHDDWGSTILREGDTLRLTDIDLAMDAIYEGIEQP